MLNSIKFACSHGYISCILLYITCILLYITCILLVSCILHLFTLVSYIFIGIYFCSFDFLIASYGTVLGWPPSVQKVSSLIPGSTDM